MKKLFKGILAITVIGCFVSGCFAADWNDELAGTTEITGYYQQYRDFSFKTGFSDSESSTYDLSPTRLSGGGFSVAQNLAEWFAIWMQLSIYGTADQPAMSVRVINELQGIRYQTKQYGPFRFYGKGGAGLTRYSMAVNFLNGFEFGSTKFSAAYGGGVNVWLNKNVGITLDVSHILNAMPNFEDLYYDDVKFQGRDKFDSGMSYTTGLTFRF